ncbi:Transposon Ty3-G Gag-Pol polyprotein [Gossypium australe]|uniref:RNA-directed DNA polymerase n=1 Tax=Gossypium australe TaxID=47621 RepID=A0A5B6UI08_9ROSI|nr:Transposon Ty3-G Gag-Pol polyprotein [Gossypium australe]
MGRTHSPDPISKHTLGLDDLLKGHYDAMDPKRAVADDVESNAPTPAQGTTPSDSRPATSGQEGEAKQAFFQMMSEWFTQFVKNNPTVSQPLPPVISFQTTVVPPVMYPNLLNKPLVDKIRKYRAEEFRATSDDDVEKAEFWLEITIQVFDEMSLTPEECIKCVVSLLRDAAYQWWKTLISIVPKERVTWDFFQSEFRKKYISERFVDQKRKEFLELKQGRMTVSEYEREFVRLSQYARECVSSKAIMCKRFEDGLNEDIRLLVVILEIKEFVVLIDRACKAETLEKDKRKAESEARNMIKRFPSKSFQSTSKRFRDDQGRSRDNVGHSNRNLARSQMSSKTPGTSVASIGDVRTERPESREEASSPDVITGTFTLYDTYVIALIDPGSTHSYICMNLVFSKTFPVESTEFAIKVSNPLGKSVLVDKVYKNCLLMFRDICFPTDLMLFPFDEFDIILGMDWLTLHDTVVNCKRKTIDLRRPNNEIFRVESNNLNGLPAVITVLKAQSYVKKGYEAYFAYVIDSKASEKKVESVPIVCEYSDVFPEELPGLPPIHEVEFGIELLLGTTPISIAPYRMAPTELKELKSQLQELTDRGFVRPSFLPWGAPVLFVKKKDGTMRMCIDYRQLNKNPSGSKQDFCYSGLETFEERVGVRSFLGLTGYYRRFVKGFSVIATLLTRLLQKDVRFEWSDNCQKSLGCVLMREGKVVAYASRQLKLHGKNYPTHDLELAAIVIALKIWRHYLYGEKCHVKLVADALSRKSLFALHAMNAQLDLSDDSSVIAEFKAKPLTLELIQLILNEAHNSRLSVHPGSSKMYHDLKRHYWWFSMKRDIFDFVSKCLVCQQVKAEHQVSSGLLQHILIPEWKWDRVTMDFVSAFHPQTDGQSERIIQILEDMLRCCILEFNGSWEQYLPLIEFAYNNSFQTSIKMAPYKALYGRKYRTPLYWTELSENKLHGVDLIKDSKQKVKLVRDLLRFGHKGKLSSRFIGSYEIIERVGPVAYRLRLPSELEKIHKVFHVSMLRRYRSDPSHVIAPSAIEIRSDMFYEEEPICVLACEVKELRKKKIPLVKILWNRHGIEEATWELEDSMRQQYPNLFNDKIYGDENP